MSTRWSRAAALETSVVLGILAVAVWSYAWILDLPLTGIDAYPTIAAASADSPLDVPAVLTRELRGGVEPSISYYRPLTLVTYTMDHFLWGWTARGYHLTDLLLHGLAAVSVYGLVRLAFRRPLPEAAAVSLLFLLHPSAVELVPAITRRQEPLLMIGVALALIGGRYVPTRRGWVLLLAGSTVAITSVERGLAIPAILFAYFATITPPAGEPLLARSRAAMARSLPAVGLAVSFFAVRAALHGAGGIAFRWLNFVWIPWDVGLALIYPQQLIDLRQPGTLGAALGLALCGVALGAGFLWLLVRSEEWRTHQCVALWIAGYFLLFTVAGQGNQWYAYSVVPALGLSLAALVKEGVRAVRAMPRRPIRATTMLGAAMAVGAAVTVPSPAFHQYPAWRIVGQQSAAILGDLGPLVDSLPADVAIGLVNLPAYYRESSASYLVTHSATGLMAHSLRAWQAVRGTSREIIVVGGSREVGDVTVPDLGITENGTLRVELPPGPERYDDFERAEPNVGTCGPSGCDFPWPVRGLKSPRLAVFVFDGRHLIPWSAPSPSRPAS